MRIKPYPIRYRAAATHGNVENFARRQRARMRIAACEQKQQVNAAAKIRPISTKRRETA